MHNDLKKHMDECLKCQVSQKAKFEKTVELQPLPQCSMPNQRIHMDLFGPCKTSHAGIKLVLTMTDAFTKYAEIVAIPNKEAVQWQMQFSQNGFVGTDAQQSSTQTWEKSSSTKSPQNCRQNSSLKDLKLHQLTHSVTAKQKYSTKLWQST